MEDVGLLIIRIMVGIVFLYYGSQKLFGLFGGHGIKGTGGWFESIGVKPGIPAAFLSGLGEFVSGILMILGLFLPVAAVIITIIMAGAIVKVHGSKGFAAGGGGFEYNLMLIVVAIGLALIGPGAFAISL
ncbi:DoxX family protein [Niallia sp. FSL R7-0271]|uniref:DoxX family protein n=1 Tax=Niallia sp. FSL R7-0271 TaxID=2921678 RepID=UPI0030F91136